MGAVVSEEADDPTEDVTVAAVLSPRLSGGVISEAKWTGPRRDSSGQYKGGGIMFLLCTRTSAQDIQYSCSNYVSHTNFLAHYAG